MTLPATTSGYESAFLNLFLALLKADRNARISLPFPSERNAHQFRLRWYGFLRAMRKEALALPAEQSAEKLLDMQRVQFFGAFLTPLSGGRTAVEFKDKNEKYAGIMGIIDQALASAAAAPAVAVAPRDDTAWLEKLGMDMSQPQPKAIHQGRAEEVMNQPPQFDSGLPPEAFEDPYGEPSEVAKPRGNDVS